MKFLLLALFAVSANASELDLYVQAFKVKNFAETVKCFASDPNSRAYGAVFLSISGTEELAASLEENSAARFTSNSYNGVFGDSPSACDKLPPATIDDGVMIQRVTLTTSSYTSGACSVILREGLHMKAYGKELYGYGHGEILPASEENCDLVKLRAKIRTASFDADKVLYADRKSEIVVQTSQPDENGMCEKRIVTKTRNGKKEGMILIPLSKNACI